MRLGPLYMRFHTKRFAPARACTTESAGAYASCITRCNARAAFAAESACMLPVLSFLSGASLTNVRITAPFASRNCTVIGDVGLVLSQ